MAFSVKFFVLEYHISKNETSFCRKPSVSKPFFAFHTIRAKCDVKKYDFYYMVGNDLRPPSTASTTTISNNLHI